MVDSERVRQLRAMQRANGWTQAQMAAVAGVSPQAAGKWFKTGKIGGASFARLVAASQRHPLVAAESMPHYIVEGDDAMDKETVQQIFEALPRAERAKWIEYGNMLVIHRAPKSAANPTPAAVPGRPRRPPYKVKAPR